MLHFLFLILIQKLFGLFDCLVSWPAQKARDVRAPQLSFLQGTGFFMNLEFYCFDLVCFPVIHLLWDLHCREGRISPPQGGGWAWELSWHRQIQGSEQTCACPGSPLRPCRSRDPQGPGFTHSIEQRHSRGDAAGARGARRCWAVSPVLGLHPVVCGPELLPSGVVRASFTWRFPSCSQDRRRRSGYPPSFCCSSSTFGSK